MQYGTLYAGFHDVSRRYPHHEALAVLRDGVYRAISYSELAERVDRCAAALQHDGLKKGGTLGLLLDNGIEWVTVDLACAKLGAIVVPMHTSYNASYVRQVITHSGLQYLVSQDKYLDKIHEALQGISLHHAYLIGASSGARINAHMHSYGELESNEFRAAEADLQGSDVHTIVYTSGTTGTPKGVMLTHANLLSNIASVTKAIPLNPEDRFFSFLPLSHILERTAGLYAPLLNGCAIYYARSAQTIPEDMRVARPTVVVSVPRIFEKAHEKILAKFSHSTISLKLSSMALHVARRIERSSSSISDRMLYPLFDKLVFSKVRAAFGGRLRFAVSGGASLPKHIGEFFDEMGVPVLEGYGLTETSPVVSVNTMGARKFGTVGKPLDGVLVKIDTNGEILVKGLNVMHGYYNAPDLTGQVIDAEGWFHTGDMGSFDQEGFLTIIGRLKEMIVLSTGRNVFPVPIEQELEESKYIAQAMVYGDNQRSISAFIVPAFAELKQWCQEHSIEYALPAILTDTKVVDFFGQEIKRCLSRMQSFEQVQNFKLLPEEFTVENDMLTLSLKLKRNAIERRYE